MHYIQHGIEKLSKNQVSKLLRGHPTRIKAGKHHNIHLSQEHSKKIMRAHQKGMGLTVQLDPYAIEHNQHLRHDVGMLLKGRGTGTDLGAVLGHVAGQAAQAGGTRLVDAIAGTDTSNNQDAYDNSMTASGLKKRRGRGVNVNVHGHIGTPKLSSLRDPISGLSFGGSVNRINKFNRWTNVLGDAYQGIAHAVKPVAKPIFEAGTQRAVEMINPESTEDYLNNYVGYGVKKHIGRPRKICGGFVSATPEQMKAREDYLKSSGEGVKKHRGRPRKMIGSALFAAGY